MGATLDGSRHICWELWLQDNVVVQVLLQVFGALVATMAIVNGKYLYLGPHVVGKFWLLS